MEQPVGVPDTNKETPKIRKTSAAPAGMLVKTFTMSNATTVKNIATRRDPAVRRAFELVRPQLESVERRILEQADGFDPAVSGYVSYVCSGGGKRLRPALALMAGGATGGVCSSHEDLAVVLELIHVATLVHDDIMDGADLRRGQPTANAKWGNAISVLLGDSLFAHALRLSTGFEDTDVSKRISDAAVDVCSGEIIQTQRRFDLKLTVEDYFRIIEKKTAALFAAAGELGARLNDASVEQSAALRTFGLKLGTAYQIYDDCVDLVGSEDKAGKTLGTDLLKGKFTLPVLMLLRHSNNGNSGRVRALLLEENSTNSAELADLIESSGSLHTALDAAGNLLDEARAVLEVIPASEYRAALLAAADAISALLRRVGSRD